LLFLLFYEQLGMMSFMPERTVRVWEVTLDDYQGEWTNIL
jgi:hypothetical protein